MLSSEELKRQLNETTENLIEVISSFSQEQFNKVPFEGSWTPGQVAEHIYKAQSGIPDLLLGNTRATDRRPDEHSAMLASIFLDFTSKMSAPDFILPSADPKDKNHFMKAFEKLAKDTDQLIDKVDLTRTLIDFAFPEVGELTGYEWLHFGMCHMKRHTWQLKNIHAIFNKVTLNNFSF